MENEDPTLTKILKDLLRDTPTYKRIWVTRNGNYFTGNVITHDNVKYGITIVSDADVDSVMEECAEIFRHTAKYDAMPKWKQWLWRMALRCGVKM